jgi:hypothetical protein
MIDKTETLGAQVREIEQQFISGNGTQTSKYVNSDLYEDINKIYAYLESKHISGETDSQGRDKPFFNIVIAARNVRYRATDIDRRNIKVRATKSTDVFGDFLATIHLQDWMRRERFGSFLNIWGMELANFNDVPTKWVEKGGRLIPSVVPWSRFICDKINFQKNLKIEILEMSEADMYEAGYDKKVIEALCDAMKARELTSKEKKDNKNDYFKLYEVHGVMPLSFITGKESDEDTYVQQMHVLSFVYKKKEKTYEEFALYKGREARDPYLMTSLMPTSDGSISLQGAVKDLFDSQWMVNHTKKQIKDQLDLASKLIFQTSDGNFVGQNALNAIESGDILIHQPNMPLTQVQNNSHDITALQNYGTEWKGLANEIAGISESMLGNAAPSGTAWRQVEALLNESHSLMDLMTENKGLCLEEMLTTFIIPFLKKKMDTSDEISATLEQYNLDRIDKEYVPYEATKRLAKTVIDHIITKGEIPEVDPEMPQVAIDGVKKELDMQGNQRFFKPSDIENKTWKEVFKDLEWELEIDITGEQKDNQSDMATLSTIFQTVAANPQALEDPRVKMLFNKILMKTGTVSPMELNDGNRQTPPAPAPSVAPPQGGAVDTGMAKKELTATNVTK